MDDNLINIHDDGIGIDPTVVPEIDSLDSNNHKLPKKAQKKEIKPSDILKKVLFTIVVLALMAGVSYGVYYYLSLGRKKANMVQLSDLEIYTGEILPSSILEYGKFNNVDVATCALDISQVDNSKAGTYKYFVKCGENKYEATVLVAEKIEIHLATNIKYQLSTETISPENFVSTENAYNYLLVDGTKMYEAGLNNVEIKVKNDIDQEIIINGLLYIVDQVPTTLLVCTKEIDQFNEYVLSVKEYFAINNEGNNMNISLKGYVHKYNDEKKYNKVKNTIQNGKIKIDSHEGFAIVDDINHVIEIVNIMNADELPADLESNYMKIGSYYRNDLGYSCSIKK